MVFTDEFKKDIQDQMSQCLDDAEKNHHELERANRSILTDHLSDFNLGYGLGFVEGVLTRKFTKQYNRLMTPMEDEELKILMYKFALQLKPLIFKEFFQTH